MTKSPRIFVKEFMETDVCLDDEDIKYDKLNEIIKNIIGKPAVYVKNNVPR